ncbi:hypothetical protein CCACVL1_03255 [Corchorus capsularis]|uniref:Uncharacterized protein n=1 Tax=Corchorus capsularis TaxID=210143 RepID=A0A1R3K1F9_COCAP|nr:hypothetical protein CCACVL1_03255 [Corchorus capsularis]
MAEFQSNKVKSSSGSTAELQSNKVKSSSGSNSMFFNRSITMHATPAESNPPKVHLLLNNPSLNRAASISKFYNSFDSVKGKVKKLCNIFESSKSSISSSNSTTTPKESAPKFLLRHPKSLGGSRKVFDEDEGLLKRCLECNENGLIRCPECCL